MWHLHAHKGHRYLRSEAALLNRFSPTTRVPGAELWSSGLLSKHPYPRTALSLDQEKRYFEVLLIVSTVIIHPQRSDS